jgi:parallel beta-helix repeat protein
MKARLLALACVLVAANLTNAYARTYSIKPGPEAEAGLAAALAAAKPKDRIQLSKGRYDLTKPVAFALGQFTLRGDGADKTVLSFTGAAQGACVQASGAQIALTDFAVENCNGDAIVVRAGDQVRLANLRVDWPGARPASASGISAINSKNVLIDTVVANGAPYAGIRVAGSSNVIVRNSVAARNTMGFAIKFTIGADAFGNTATHNTAGFVLFDEPNMAQAGGGVRIFKNQIVANDNANNAPKTSYASTLPVGVGVYIAASKDVALFDNQIGENASVNVLIGGYRNSVNDARFNALPRNIAVRNNTFGRSGFSPQGDVKIMMDMGAKPADVIWDGASAYYAGGVSRQEPVLLAIDKNKRDDGGPVRVINLGLFTAGADYGDMNPGAPPPSISSVPEVAPVKLPKGL